MKFFYYIITLIVFIIPSISFSETVVIDSKITHQDSPVDRPSNHISNTKSDDKEERVDKSTQYVRDVHRKGNHNLNTYKLKERHYVVRNSNHYRSDKSYHVTRSPSSRTYSSVIVYRQPPSNVYLDQTEYEQEDGLKTVKNFGIGINGIVATNSAVGNLNGHSSGGFGYYIKYRPVRFLSVEFTNDFLFGDLTYTDENISQSYTKIPLSLGFRFHFMDYNDFDAYASVAGTLASIKYHNNYSRDPHFANTGYQHGGQFGLGFSYIIDYFELGFDVRYTIESIPDLVPYYISTEESQIIHGAIFKLSIGFIL